MKYPVIAALTFVAVVAFAAWGTVSAQQKPADMNHDMAGHQHESMPGMSMPAQTTPAQPMQSTVAEVFCPTMKTGQLCSHGSADALQLTGAKYDQWIAAVRTYNKAVDQATVQLQAQMKTVLTPQQLTEVQRWFALGLNPQINTLLAESVNKK